ncbi:MAG: hypothetical protein A3E25_02775 [Burkholderiales bacterium RIFCSPHIGHO2_12_FULL_69_20]|nr:MAG: hypothetical protein A3E25_02775 [Burkholderiales bacterium RIFCSPHIGHO2_12_FULL_69_20]
MVAQPSAASAALRAIALMVVLVFGALVAGAGVALVGVPFTAVVAGVVLGGFALFVPLTWLLWLMFGLTFVVVGAAQYFGGVSKGFWAPYLLGALLMLRVPMERYRASTGASSVERRPALPMDAGLFSAMVALFFIIALASTLFNLSPWLQVFVSAKEYLFLWSICFLVAAGHAGAGFERRIWLALLWLAPLQVPVVLYQRFVVAVSRQGSSAWDAVVGLFGGDPEGGGASAAMAFFVMFCALLALSLWRSRQLRLRYVVAVVLSALVCIALAEVKAVILLLPLGIAVLFRRELLRRPFQALAFVVGAVVLSVGLIVAYQAQFASARSTAGHSVEAYAQLMFERAADSDSYQRDRARMNRTTAFVYWWQNHQVSDPVRFFLGDGIGATRVGSLAVGDTARRHPYRLNTTTASQLLWETGLLGLAAAAGLLLAGMRMAGLASRDSALTAYQRAVAAAAQPMLLITLVGVAYNTDFIGTPPAQLLAMLLLGYLYRLRRLGGQQAAHALHGKP